MIPLRDSIRSRRFPLVNVTLIAINVLVFLFEIMLSDRQVNALFLTYGLVPAQFGTAGIASLIPLITSQFLHGGPLHVGGNMLYLWVFGDNIEDKMGHFKYLLFYLLLGSISGLTHVMFNPGSPVPTVGASGAVAGILGAYFMMFPRSRVLALVPLVIFWSVTEVPAVIFLFLWFILQLVSGVASVGRSQIGAGVAWWAHIGGFVAGAVLVRVFRSRRTVPRY